MKSKNRLDKVLGIVTFILSVMISVSGICLIASALHIYFSGGDTPYSQKTVRSHLLFCLPSLILTVLLAVAVFVLRRVTQKSEKNEAVRYPRMILKNIYKTYGDKGDKKLSLTEKEKEDLKIGRKRITAFRLASVAVCVIAAAVSLILALNSSSYTIEDVNGSVISVVIVVLPLTAVALGALYASRLLADRLYENELNILLTAIKSRSERVEGEDFTKQSSVVTALRNKEKQILLSVRIGVLALSVCFIILGIFNGGAGDVLGKAVRICTECIGLG